MGISILILLFLLLLNGVFAMSELAMMTSRQSRLQQSAAEGSKGAAAALALASHPTRFLSIVQMGITLVGILAGAIGERAFAIRLEEVIAGVPALAPYGDSIALGLVVIVITYVSLVLGELVPKRLALTYPELIASTISRPLTILSRIGAWPVRLLTWSTEAVIKILRVKPIEGDDVSEEDVRALMARAASNGVFTRQEHALFNRLLRVGDFTVRDLMVPRREIVWVEESARPEDLRALLAMNPYSHFPVCRGGLDHLLGAVHIKDLIAYGLLAGADFPITAVAQKPLLVSPATPALRLLDQFKAARVHIALVVDKHNAIQGLLTLNDVVSALVGNVSRRNEESTPRAIRRADGSWLIDGRLPMAELLATLGLTPDETTEGIRTAAGLVLTQLGRPPKEAEHVAWRGWDLEVVDMDGAEVDQILATQAATE